MADISVMNVGGSDYNIKDATSRTNSTKAMSLSAYYETGDTASQAYSIVGTPINWKGTLYYTKTTVAKGATWVVGTNLTAANNLGKLVRNIKTYVGSDSKLHFVDLTGADTALNFSSGITLDLAKNQYKVKRPTSNSSGIWPYPDYSSGTISAGTTITFAPYSAFTPIAFDANVESFSTMKIQCTAGSNQSECTMIGKDGKVYNGRIGISTSLQTLDISNYDYIMIGIMWSGSSTSFNITFN